MRRASSALLALGCWWLTGTGAQAQDANAGADADPQQAGPDLDFLEYLGTWAEEDDEWLAIEEWQKDEAAKPGEDPEGSETEKGDDDENE